MKHAHYVGKDEAQTRLLQTIGLLENCWGDFKMIALLSQKWGCSPRSVDRYIAKARRIINAQVQRTRDEKAGEVIMGLRAIIADPKTPSHVKVAAFRELSKIYGIRAPKEIAITGPQVDGRDLLEAANATPEGREAARMGAEAILKVSAERRQRMAEPGRN